MWQAASPAACCRGLDIVIMVPRSDGSILDSLYGTEYMVYGVE